MNGTIGGGVLVGTDWLEERLGDVRVRVVEVVVSPKSYDAGHIPGAVLWNVYTDLKDGEYRLLDRAGFERLLSRSGIDRDTTVVFYGYAPAFGLWLMKLHGHRDARLLDASRETWQAEGRPWTVDAPSLSARAYRLPNEDGGVRALQPDVERAIGSTECMIADVRTADEYAGGRFWPSGGMETGGRAGHVPGARHVPMDDLYDARGAFRRTAELREVFSVIEDADVESVITYCTVGGRAATAWFVLTYLLGDHRVRVYDGSWAEWGRMAATPVEANPPIAVAAPALSLSR